MSKSRIRPKRVATLDRQGFVLITVMVMLTVATLMMSGLASNSLQEASIALQEEQAMRNRWSSTCIRRFVLNHAAGILAEPTGQTATSDPGPPINIKHRDFDLGGQTWRIVLADESSKLNVHQLAKERRQEQVVAVGNQLLSGSTRLRFRPDRSGLVQGAKKRWNSKRWDRWFDVLSQDMDPVVIAAATQNVTLWGDGRLNVLRCDPLVLDSLWKELFGRSAPQQIHDLRHAEDNIPLRDAFRLAGMRETNFAKAQRWFKTDSNAHSIWLFCPSDRRIQPVLFVRWGSNGIAAEHRGYEY